MVVTARSAVWCGGRCFLPCALLLRRPVGRCSIHFYFRGFGARESAISFIGCTPSSPPIAAGHRFGGFGDRHRAAKRPLRGLASALFLIGPDVIHLRLQLSLNGHRGVPAPQCDVKVLSAAKVAARHLRLPASDIQVMSRVAQGVVGSDARHRHGSRDRTNACGVSPFRRRFQRQLFNSASSPFIHERTTRQSGERAVIYLHRFRNSIVRCLLIVLCLLSRYLRIAHSDVLRAALQRYHCHIKLYVDVTTVLEDILHTQSPFSDKLF